MPSIEANNSFVEWLFRPSMLFRVSLIAGVCALWPYAVQRLPSLGKRPEYRMAFQKIELLPQPGPFVPTNLIEQVKKGSKFPDELSVLDEGLSQEIAEAFCKHPWVSKVIRVQKSFPAAIVVELEYRRPVAAVQVSEKRIPIDADAFVLPFEDFAKGAIDGFPVIQYAASKPIAVAGTIWSDEKIVAAAKLANFLGGAWKSLKLAAISVSQNSTESKTSNDVQFELISADGSRILWGRGIGSDYPGELKSTQKILRLEKYLAEFGDYGQPHGPYEIDIRHWRENTRRPLVSDESQTKPARVQKFEPRTQSSEVRRKHRI